MSETIAQRNVVSIVVTPGVSAAGKLRLPGPRATLMLFNLGDARAEVTSSLVVPLLDTWFLRDSHYFGNYRQYQYTVNRAWYSRH